MELALEQGSEKAIHLWGVLGFGLLCRFEKGKGNFLISFDKGVGIQAAIMHNPPIKEPWPSQKDMTSLHGHNITP